MNNSFRFNLIEFCTAFFVILDMFKFVDTTFVKQKFDNISVLN